MAVSSRSRSTARPRRWPRILAWVAPIFLVFLVIASFVAKAAIDSYLHSDRFRTFVSRKAGGTLHADADLLPLNFTGMEVYTDGFTAKGGPDAAFASMQLDQLRAELSLKKFLDKAWVVEQVDVARLKVNLDGPRADRPLEHTSDPLSAPKTESNSENTGWLPNRVEVNRVLVHDTQLLWAGGGLKNTAFELLPYEGGWQISGQGGRLEYGKLPALDVSSLKLGYRAPSLFVKGAELRQPGGGSVQATGEINFEREVDLTLNLLNVDTAPYLSEDWRMRAKGNISGEVTVRSPLPVNNAGPLLKGSLKITNGELTALPVLDGIAKYTHTDQFRRLNLTNASGTFEQQGERLSVTKFMAESEGLICMKGDFTITGGMIDGYFQVGVTPGSLQWLPGAQAKVFTASHDGYLWSPLHLTGPVDHPKDDLTDRLVAAAQDAVIDGVKKQATDVINSGKDVTKGILDFVLPGSK